MNSLFRNIINKHSLIRLNANYKCLNRSISLHTSKFSNNNNNSSNSSNNDDSIDLTKITNNENSYYDNVRQSYNTYIEHNRGNENIEKKRARLIYQSRKRGITETGILLNNFAEKYLSSMNESQLDDYDKIINSLNNEWDIYYWLTNAAPIPSEFQNNKIIDQLKTFCLNEKGETRDYH